MADVSPLFSENNTETTSTRVSPLFSGVATTTRGVSPLFDQSSDMPSRELPVADSSKYGNIEDSPSVINLKTITVPSEVDPEEQDEPTQLPEIKVSPITTDNLEETQDIKPEDIEPEEPEKSFQERVDVLIFKHYDKIYEDENFQKYISNRARMRVDQYNEAKKTFEKKFPNIWQEFLNKQEDLKKRGLRYAVPKMVEGIRSETEIAEMNAAELSKKTLARLNNRNFMTRNLAQGLLTQVEEGYLSLNQLNAIVSIDEWFDPFTAVVEVPHNFKDVQEHLKNGEGKEATFDAFMGSLNLLTALPGAKLVTGTVSSGWKYLSGGRGAYHDVQEAMTRETQRAIEIKRAAKEVADNNKEVRNQLIKEFQEKFDVEISTKDKNGNLKVDPTLVRETGKKKVSEYYTDMGYVGTDGNTVKLTDYAINDESLAIPILDPEKMDMFVSTIVGLKKANPDIAKALETTGDEKLIDKLFDMTLEKDLIGSEELLDVLTKNGLSFEEYVLGIVGSGSQAGKLLNQLSQIKRIKPNSVREAQEQAAKIDVQRGFGRFWASTVLRGENIRRGLMVSSLATAVRNLQSGVVRSPMESFADVMDTAMLTYTKARSSGKSRPRALQDFTNSINPLVRDGTWSGSFNNLRYIFLEQGRAQEFTDYILDRPELAEQMSKMFNNINEIQEYTGRGKAHTQYGKAADKVATRMEDFVWAVNGPNRWQEHMIRRATFLSDLERQMKLNWDIDLQQALKEGKIQDILNDAPSVRPEGSKSFLSMVETSTQKALDVTYAKQPDLKLFKDMTQLITKSGIGTVVIPFPRFMFNSMEYMAQNTAGALLVPIRKAISKESRAAGITARDRQDISRNLVGIAAMMGYYQVRKQYGTNDYTMLATEDEQVDLTAQYPMRQIAWITEAYDRYQEGTLETWYGMENKELAETWLGTAARTGVGNVFIDEIRNGIVGTEDELDADKRKKAIGRFFGQYAATFLTPMFQLAESQRVAGIRETDAKDFKGSITADTNLPYGESAGVRAFYEVIAQRGMAAPSFEAELPDRIMIDKGKIQRPDSASKLYGGLTVTERDNDVTDYLNEIGFSDATYRLGSKSKINEARIAENEFMSMIFPTMVNLVQNMAEARHPDSKKNEHLFARKEIRNVSKKLKEKFREPSRGAAPPIAVIADRLSRLTKEERKYGIVQFKANNMGRLPELDNISDLIQLEQFSKQGIFK